MVKQATIAQIQRSVDWGLVGLIVVEVGLAIAYLVGIARTGTPYAAVDFNGKQTLPSLLQAVQLGLLGLIPLGLFLFHRIPTLPPSRSLLLVTAVLFLYAAVDEVLKIHLMLGHRLWQILYPTLGTAVLIWFRRDLMRLWRFERRSLLFVAIGMGIFVLGGFGTELLKSFVIRPLLSQFLNQHGTIALWLESSRIAIEEFSELLGESLTLYGVCGLAMARLMKAPSLYQTPEG